MKLVWRILRVAVGVAIVVGILLLVGRLVVGVAGSTPVLTGFDETAERGGCPSTPNCISTFAVDPVHAIEPIVCEADSATAIEVFDDAISTLPDVERTGPQSWTVYSRIMRFPDDVRIQVSERGIEVFSASRLGPGDLGVNRRRVEYLRELVTADERCQ